MSVFQAIVLAIVEGLTEFLPVSSTGHMIIASTAMGISSNEFVKAFTVAIQLGAITSVVLLYWRRFLQSIRFYFVLLAGFIPAAVIGFLLGDKIDALLERVDVVGWTLIAGGVFFLFVDRIFRSAPIAEDVTSGKAFRIGCIQCIALIPGVSRSAATIIGGLSQGLSRTKAAEFSFFLAVPTMFAATAYKLLKFYLAGGSFGSNEVTLLIIGNVVAFAVALAAIRSFIGFLTRHGFRWFGYYRIVAGATILILYYFGAQMDVF